MNFRLTDNFENLGVVISGGELNDRREVIWKNMENLEGDDLIDYVRKQAFSFVSLSSGAPRLTASVLTENHILIGCDYEWKFNRNDTIPLVGYSDGIHKKFDFGNGRILEGLDMCGLIFSKVKPINWKEKFGLSDYIFRSHSN